jgi:hypothetical protein
MTVDGTLIAELLLVAIDLLRMLIYAAHWHQAAAAAIIR